MKNQKHAGAKEATEKDLIHGSIRDMLPQGLKPDFILPHLWHG
jgi:hypothetical protein